MHNKQYTQHIQDTYKHRPRAPLPNTTFYKFFQSANIIFGRRNSLSGQQLKKHQCQLNSQRTWSVYDCKIINATPTAPTPHSSWLTRTCHSRQRTFSSSPQQQVWRSRPSGQHSSPRPSRARMSLRFSPTSHLVLLLPQLQVLQLLKLMPQQRRHQRRFERHLLFVVF